MNAAIKKAIKIKKVADSIKKSMRECSEPKTVMDINARNFMDRELEKVLNRLLDLEKEVFWMK